MPVTLRTLVDTAKALDALPHAALGLHRLMVLTPGLRPLPCLSPDLRRVLGFVRVEGAVKPNGRPVWVFRP